MKKVKLDSLRTPTELQMAVGKCMFEAQAIVNEIVKDPGQGEELGKRIGIALIAMGCEPFLKISMKMAVNKAQNSNAGDDLDNEKGDVKRISGIVKAIEEREFLVLKIQLLSGRETEFIVLTYIADPDEWLKDPAKLKGKKVEVEYWDLEVYSPKLKNYYTIRQLRGLQIK